MPYFLRNDVKFPYCDIYGVYIKCAKNEHLRRIFRHLIKMIYPECIDAVYPITSDEITNRHFTFAVNVLTARSFYDNFAEGEVYPWHVNAISVQVPYGNIDDWYMCSTDWRAQLARTLRCVWHGFRLIPNQTPTQRTYVNVGLPWILLDKEPEDMTDQELYDYAEIILSSISGQIWVQDKKIITPHVHSC